jgi:hypothetical protein
VRNRWVLQAGAFVIVFCSIFVLAGCVIIVSSVVGREASDADDLLPGTIFLAIAASGVRVGFGLRRSFIDVSAAGLHVRNVFGQTTIPWARVTGFRKDVWRRKSVSGYYAIRDDGRAIALDALGRGVESKRLFLELNDEFRRRRDGPPGAGP